MTTTGLNFYEASVYAADVIHTCNARVIATRQYCSARFASYRQYCSALFASFRQYCSGVINTGNARFIAPARQYCSGLSASYCQHCADANRNLGNLFTALLLGLEVISFVFDIWSAHWEGAAPISFIISLILFLIITEKIYIRYGHINCTELTLEETLQIVICGVLVLISYAQMGAKWFYQKRLNIPLSAISLTVSVTIAVFQFMNQRKKPSRLICQDQVYNLADLHSQTMPAADDESRQIPVLVCGCTEQV
ncbi:hypothetical protein QQP08_023642 [Theobroma cacao]|nr:hypothetical protein QQP08_023642 [Theobroma cacao]